MCTPARSQRLKYSRKALTLSRYSIRSNTLPILGWSCEQVHDYLRHNGLPLHPLHEQGYTTVGDWHSSRPANTADGHEREARFGGLKQECGLHLP